MMRGLGRREHENALICPVGCDLGQAAASVARRFEMPMGGDLDLMLVPRVRRVIRHYEPDVVHLHSRIGADVMGGIAARLAGTPVVHSRRVDNPEPRWLVALKYRLHDRVIAISEGIGRVLLSEGLPPDKLRVVRSAVDVDRFDRPCHRAKVCAALGVPEQARLVAVIAQLIPRKGHRFLLQALPELARDFPELRIVFLGKGAEETELRRLAGEAGVADSVLFAGFRDDLPDILPCLDLVVHPALMEGLGVSLLQASSAGVPIVASRAGGIPEAVRDGLNGLLVPPGDAPALGQAMRRLLGDQDLARGMGRAGRKLMRDEFSLDVMVEGNLAVYRELLASRAAGRGARR